MGLQHVNSTPSQISYVPSVPASGFRLPGFSCFLFRIWIVILIGGLATRVNPRRVVAVRFVSFSDLIMRPKFI
jgi:hypothetical protein